MRSWRVVRRRMRPGGTSLGEADGRANRHRSVASFRTHYSGAITMIPHRLCFTNLCESRDRLFVLTRVVDFGEPVGQEIW